MYMLYVVDHLFTLSFLSRTEGKQRKWKRDACNNGSVLKEERKNSNNS